MPYSKDYIACGDVFADESVFCIRCGTQIMGLGYKEMPSVNDPKKTVNVVHKKKFGNYHQLPVVLSRRGRETITSLPCCQECLKEIDPSRDTDEIIRQIRRAMQIEARWAGMPEEGIQAVANAWADARVIRKMSPQEIAEGRILEVA